MRVLTVVVRLARPCNCARRTPFFCILGSMELARNDSRPPIRRRNATSESGQNADQNDENGCITSETGRLRVGRRPSGTLAGGIT